MHGDCLENVVPTCEIRVLSTEVMLPPSNIILPPSAVLVPPSVVIVPPLKSENMPPLCRWPPPNKDPRSVPDLGQNSVSKGKNRSRSGSRVRILVDSWLKSESESDSAKLEPGPQPCSMRLGLVCTHRFIQPFIRALEAPLNLRPD